MVTGTEALMPKTGIGIMCGMKIMTDTEGSSSMIDVMGETPDGSQRMTPAAIREGAIDGKCNDLGISWFCVKGAIL